MPNRHASSSEYRYGFQGQEKDDEIKGEGNSLNYTFRMHDPRVGRFFARDPLEKKYPFYSPYQFSGNRVIDSKELEGLEPESAGKGEGESAWDFDKSVPDDALFQTLQIAASFQKWYWHSGTSTSGRGWKKANEYKEVVMPFCLDMASSRGFTTGSTWQDAQKLLITPKNDALIHGKSENLKEFLSNTFNGDVGNFFELNGRNYYPGIVEDKISDIGANRMRSSNEQKVYSAMGLCQTADEYSPVFFFTGALYNATCAQKMGIGYRAISAEFAESTINNNAFFRSGAAGRLGGDGIYFNSTPEGAIKEFSFHSSATPALFEVHYPISKPFLFNTPPSIYQTGIIEGTEGFNILTAPSLRAPGTMNFLIRSGEKVGKQIK